MKQMILIHFTLVWKYYIAARAILIIDLPMPYNVPIQEQQKHVYVSFVECNFTVALEQPVCALRHDVINIVQSLILSQPALGV